MKMEELIHHFIVATQGIDAPPGEVYFGAENPKGELGFYICSKGGGVPYRLKIRAPSFVNLSILSKLLPGHMVSDVPVGAFLSGGGDSSIIVAMMSKIADQPVKTFSVGVPYENYSELPYARMVAEQYRVLNEELPTAFRRWYPAFERDGEAHAAAT